MAVHQLLQFGDGLLQFVFALQQGEEFALLRSDLFENDVSNFRGEITNGTRHDVVQVVAAVVTTVVGGNDAVDAVRVRVQLTQMRFKSIGCPIELNFRGLLVRLVSR